LDKYDFEIGKKEETCFLGFGRRKKEEELDFWMNLKIKFYLKVILSFQSTTISTSRVIRKILIIALK